MSELQLSPDTVFLAQGMCGCVGVEEGRGWKGVGGGSVKEWKGEGWKGEGEEGGGSERGLADVSIHESGGPIADSI